MPVTYEEAKDYLGIDFDDAATQRNIERHIKTADKYFIGSLGENYPKDDSRVKDMALIVISDLYDNHDLNDKVSGSIRRLITDFSLQIKMEMRRAEHGV
ncbi:head-tail connector protein [Bacillus sp. JJ722]|uniref:head-tail connector protein n=1 Tax=Bacillus sp. JJ722 TaxID=3122973 RepID=UPI002FFDD7C7